MHARSQVKSSQSALLSFMSPCFCSAVRYEFSAVLFFLVLISAVLDHARRVKRGLLFSLLAISVRYSGHRLCSGGYLSALLGGRFAGVESY